MEKQDTFEQFVMKAHKIHGVQYQYVEPYSGQACKIQIICKIHGPFVQKAQTHLLGSRCPKCSQKNQAHSFSDFEHISRTVHGSKYQYTPPYKNAHTKVTIICPLHGPFKQTPDNHIRGKQGCSKCAHTAFKTDIPSIVYVLELQSGNEHFVKVGITNDQIRRFREIKQSYNISNQQIFPVATGKQAVDIETQIMDEQFDMYSPSTPFKGKTECYRLCEKTKIVEFITKVVQTQSTTV